jgi:ABC-type branched-subunit amino acid transport system substrate-binding protein
MPQASSGNGGPPAAGKGESSAGDREAGAVPGRRREPASQVLRRWFPSPRSTPRPNWWQLSRGYLSAGVILALLAGGISAARTPPGPAPRCHGTPGSDIWYQGKECVGISDGSYTFGYPQVMGKILALNRQHASCASTGSRLAPVTIGAMVTLYALNTGVRAQHELEGFAAALFETTQGAAQLRECVHPIRLLVAQMGANEQAAKREAQMLRKRGAVAVVGMGLSSQASANAAAVLSQAPGNIPMVADLITAEGFDLTGSQADGPRFGNCLKPPASADYENGFPGFFRVSYRAKIQVAEILAYLSRLQHAGQPYLVEPSVASDPYSCTALPLITNGLAQQGMGSPLEETFSSGDADPSQQAVTDAICHSNGAVNVIYAARAVFLSTLLNQILQRRENNQCFPRNVTVLSQSDAAELRVTAPDDLESTRRRVLADEGFRGGWLRVLYTPLADPDLISEQSTQGYRDLLASFAAEDFATPDLDDGWAIMAYDALAVVATAVKQIGGSVKAQLVQDWIQDASDNLPPGADGLIKFNQGNRVGPGPGLVRLCPAGGPWAYAVTTVPVRGGVLPPCTH